MGFGCARFGCKGGVLVVGLPEGQAGVGDYAPELGRIKSLLWVLKPPTPLPPTHLRILMKL